MLPGQARRVSTTISWEVRSTSRRIGTRRASSSRWFPIVYVDIDPVAVAHSRQILAGNDRATAIQQDARRPEQILEHPEVRRLLDLSRPTAMLVVSMLHFIPDSDDPAGIMHKLHDALAPGSYLVLSHLTSGNGPGGATPDGGWSDTFANPRSLAEVARFFAGFDLVEPGLVPVEQWRPDAPGTAGDNPALLCMHAGVGRKA